MGPGRAPPSPCGWQGQLSLQAPDETWHVVRTDVGTRKYVEAQAELTRDCAPTPPPTCGLPCLVCLVWARPTSYWGGWCWISAKRCCIQSFMWSALRNRSYCFALAAISASGSRAKRVSLMSASKIYSTLAQHCTAALSEPGQVQT